MATQLSRDVVKRLLYGSAVGNRYLQGSPVLLDVWEGYAADPGGRLDLLITPYGEEPAHLVGDAIYGALRGPDGKDRGRWKGFRPRAQADVSDVPGIVAARLRLDELTNILLPLTAWWEDYRSSELAQPGEGLAEAVIAKAPALNPFRNAPHGPEAALGGDEDGTLRILLLIGLIGAPAGALAAYATLAPDAPLPDALADHIRDSLARRIDPGFIGETRYRLDDLGIVSATKSAETWPKLIFLVTCNRRPAFATARSVPTIKADATRRLFQADTSDLTWAVIDSGIDSTHDAFLDFEHVAVDGGGDEAFVAATRTLSQEDRKSRVTHIYDMTRIRALRSRDFLRRMRATKAREAEAQALAMSAPAGLDAAGIAERLKQLAENARARRPMDWELIEPLVLLKETQPPVSPHGTHVAGILGAGPNDKTASGVCPEIKIRDFRVIGRDPGTPEEVAEETEFVILAALRMIRYLNARNDWMTVHGVNLSLSLVHDVDNYACGHTPVCVEATRLVENGVVVVAAAGNRGYHEVQTKTDAGERWMPMFAMSSITDPGNAELVITVGSTHRLEPHTYGVSYFSSRGPTSDGRIKPDLVAPGEKITSAGPGNGVLTLGGTSMAAPHVSGAAALLMARFPELIGKPREIKRILCDSATDLGRERYFQGCGLLDVLRAAQSI